MQSSKRFSERDLEKIKRSDEEQRKFKNFVTTNKDFTEIEKAAINFNTPAEFTSFWQQATDAKNGFDEGHAKGCGLCSKSYQTSAVAVLDFMNDFSPIIEIVKDFAAPYGGMALGTISVLFTVAGNKDRMEASMASTINAIKDRLPGMKMYQHIYNENYELDTRLQVKIVSAYQGFIDFCIMATKYYKGGGSRRWLKAMGRPKSILDQAAKVQATIVEIRLLCDELLDRNVYRITQYANGLKAEVEELLRAQDDSRRNEIQRLLNLDSFSEESLRAQLIQYRTALDSDEQLNAEFFRQMRGYELESFKSGTDYRSWATAEQSCLLVLSGYNNRSILLNTDHCWVSPVAMALLDDMSRKSLTTTGPPPIYAYYVFAQRGEPLYYAFSVVLLQLLRQKTHALRNTEKYDELRAELHELRKFEQGSHRYGHDDEADDADRLSAFHKVILRILNFFNEDETVHVILDRVDRCQERNGVDHRKALLKALVKIVEVVRCRLHVLVVINGYSWPVETYSDELGGKVKGKFILHTAEQTYSV